MFQERQKLEGSEKDKRIKMRGRVEEYKKIKRVEVMERARKRNCARATLEKVDQFLTAAEVENVLSSSNKMHVDAKLQIIKDQLKIFRDLMEFGYKAVRMGHAKDVPAPGGRMKKKKLSGGALLEWLCGQLLTLMGEVQGENGVVKSWTKVLAAKSTETWSQAAPGNMTNAPTQMNVKTKNPTTMPCR